MTKVDWDDYFYTRYKPVQDNWSEKDLQKYRSWYRNWIQYIWLSFSESEKKGFKKGLEIGSGIGGVSSLLIDNGIEMVLSDVSRVMISAGKQLFSNNKYIYLDIEKKTFNKDRYDFIVAMEVLEHLNKTDESIDHIYSLLDSDGWFIGTTPYPYPKNMTDSTHVNVQKPDYWINIFKKHNFRNVFTKPLSCLPLLWRINSRLNVILPFYIGMPYIVSTSVLYAQK